MKIFLILAILLSSSVFAKTEADYCGISNEEIKKIFDKFQESSNKLKVSNRRHAVEVRKTWDLCNGSTRAICNENLDNADKKTIINFVAQLGDDKVKREILDNLLPTANSDNGHFENLMQYLKSIEDKCSPPKFDMCTPERYQAVFAEYFNRISKETPNLARSAERTDSFYKSIPGLKSTTDEVNGQSLSFMNNAEYVSAIGREYPQGTTSIILNQARKKSLNDVSKGVSDLIGNKGNELYFQRLNEALKRNGLPEIGDGVYIDYKEAAIVLDNSKIGDPAKFREIAEQAARDADRDLRNYVENNFPETLYLMNDADRNAAWINTSVFPGNSSFTAQTTEALNAYRAREMRLQAAAKLMPAQVIKSFVSRGQNAIRYMGRLRGNYELVGKGIIKPKGEALFHHADNINAPGLSDNLRVKAVEAALVEGDANATKIIRSAPVIAQEAIAALPDSIKRRIGYKEVLASGDDSIVVADSLNDLAANKSEFKGVMLEIADNLSKAKKDLTMTHNGATSNRTIGSEVLRFFGGPNKKLAEEAEKAMKPVEDYLAKADFLGTTWREDYPEVGMAIWKNSDGSHDVFINGDSVDDKFLGAIEKVKGHLRSDDRITIHVN